jgi:hypothetical protein
MGTTLGPPILQGASMLGDGSPFRAPGTERSGTAEINAGAPLRFFNDFEIVARAPDQI